MRMSITSIVFYVLCLLFQNPAAAQNTTTSSAKIVFDKNVYDYDTLEQGANGDCLFRFTINGSAPLLITDVNASCGCTKPRWDKKPVMPGKSGRKPILYQLVNT